MENHGFRLFGKVLATFLALTAGVIPAASVGLCNQALTLPSFPCQIPDNDMTAYGYLYVAGGYHSVDNGCPAWGTADPCNIRMIGDSMGDIVITYKDGSVEKVPLIFGYTLWYHNPWQEECTPFKGSKTDRNLSRELRSILSFKGAFEGNDTCILRIRLSGKAVKSVTLDDNTSKEGVPVIKGCLLTTSDGDTEKLTLCGVTFNPDDTFYQTHTVDASDPYPASVADSLSKINRALMTYEDDYQNAPAYGYSEEQTAERVVFSGTPLANIASGIVDANAKNLAERVDADGMLHTSYKNAPSWRYDGFGYWIVNANSYYDSYYSRDGGRALMTLCSYGYTDVAERSVIYANGQMMYFPDQKLTFGGRDIPGHYTVVINKPLLYSTVLVPQAGWATQYTRAKFGDEYVNLGNQETDGQGLMMMANYTVWKNLGSSPEWVKENWAAVKEAPAWIEWCYENPDLSFVRDGLLYAESEAGMMQYTLYCNVPCMLGMYGYAEMAKSAGYTAEADAWQARADSMKDAILAHFIRPRTGTWSSNGFGFFHDPVLTMLSDIYGYDPDGYPEAFSGMVEASRKSYAADITTVSDFGYVGASGIGYNHSMITQNALLTDHMADATKLVENLCRIGYAPRLDSPYIIPEGVTYDSARGAYRRQGDLGNLVQVAEALKVYDIVIGVGALCDGRIDILPRLPENWSMAVEGHHVKNSTVTADVSVTYPENGTQNATVGFDSGGAVDTVRFRFGPLPADTKYAAVWVNGENLPCTFSLTGDSAWVFVTFEPSVAGANELVLKYGPDIESVSVYAPPVGTDTETDTDICSEDSTPSDTDTECDTSNGTAGSDMPGGSVADGTETSASSGDSGGCGSVIGVGLSVALIGAAAAALTLGKKSGGKKHGGMAAIGLCATACLISCLTGCGSDRHTNVSAGNEDVSECPSEPGNLIDSDDVTQPVAATLPDETGPDITADTQAVEMRLEVPAYYATAGEWETEAPGPEPLSYGPDTMVDLVRGNGYATVSASSTEGGNAKGPLGPLSCFDGDLNTRWSSEQHDVDGAWLCVDFGYPVRVCGLFVNEVTVWGKISSWEAQYWCDGTGEWVTVTEGFNFTNATFYGFDGPTEPTYRFRLHFFECSSLAISLYEVKIVGEFVEVPEGTLPRDVPKEVDAPAVTGVPDGLVNLALGADCAASSSESPGTPQELGPYYCFDGKENTRWSTVFHDLFESWISVDFGKTVTVYGFCVNEVTNWGHVTSYSAQILTGDGWVTVYNGKRLPTDKDVYVPLDQAVETNGFRLLFHDGETLSETVTLSEVKVYGK